MAQNGLDMEIQFLPGVGPKRSALIGKELGINSVGDLLRFYPFRYIDRSSFVRIADARADMAYIQIRAKVTRIDILNNGKRLSVMVSDQSGEIEMVFFKGIKWMVEKLKTGQEYIFFGKPSAFGNKINMVHPEVDNITASTPAESGKGGMMTGVYQSTEKLKNGGVTGKVMNKLMGAALEKGLGFLEESLPEYILRQHGLVPLHFAVRNIHFPKDLESLEKARYRLKFEELFYLQLSLLKQKYVRSRAEQGIQMPKVGEAFNRCYESLPFPLTGAQKRVITEIRNDMKSGHQMNRLLQGDVGSGKTMVAVLTALIAIGNSYQACIMAPTEVLAQQHYKNICKYLAPTGVKAALLTGSSKTSERREIHQGLEDGSIGIIVGTHALIEDNVRFRNLGLAIVDEQHRFGVEQRAKLWKKSSCGIPPHVLVMTATPIPRTLAMTLYGDLDVSVIDELPPGRKPIQTIHQFDNRRASLYSGIRKQINEGRQVYIVYPLIKESEKIDIKNLEEGYELVCAEFPECRVSKVHGQMKPVEKDAEMQRFVNGETQIMVATTVIEVGVNVPNASVMVIENAERFGLSQLHQLRGRVGRGADQSYCILVTSYKLSEETRKRLEIMVQTNDGFEIAEADLKLRGPGDLEGTQQSGVAFDLKIADIARDGQLLQHVREVASVIIDNDPAGALPENGILWRQLQVLRKTHVNWAAIS